MAVPRPSLHVRGQVEVGLGRHGHAGRSDGRCHAVSRTEVRRYDLTRCVVGQERAVVEVGVALEGGDVDRPAAVGLLRQHVLVQKELVFDAGNEGRGRGARSSVGAEDVEIVRRIVVQGYATDEISTGDVDRAKVQDGVRAERDAGRRHGRVHQQQRVQLIRVGGPAPNEGDGGGLGDGQGGTALYLSQGGIVDR